jgi:SH3-like domain-containing protein
MKKSAIFANFKSLKGLEYETVAKLFFSAIFALSKFAHEHLHLVGLPARKFRCLKISLKKLVLRQSQYILKLLQSCKNSHISAGPAKQRSCAAQTYSNDLDDDAMRLCSINEKYSATSKEAEYIPLFALIFCLFSTNVFAEKKIEEKNYFASLRAAETNVRAGPGQNYPIKFTFKTKNIPVRVINEYDNWDEIEDYEGQTGWVSQNLLTKKRMLMLRTTNSFVDMHSKDNEKSRILYHLENNVIGEYLKCMENWCAIKIHDKKGWVEKSALWGAE